MTKRRRRIDLDQVHEAMEDSRMDKAIDSVRRVNKERRGRADDDAKRKRGDSESVED